MKQSNKGLTSPKTVYHGSPAADSIKNNHFSYDFIGKGNDTYGYGFYFTTESDVALGYGDVIKAEVNLKKPIIIDGYKDVSDRFPKLTQAQVKKIILQAPDIKSEDSPLENFGDVSYEGFNTVLNKAVSQYNGTDNFYSLMNDFFRAAPEKFLRAYNKATGYDGVIVKFSDSAFYVAWFPEQIKILKEELEESEQSITDSKNFKRWFEGSKVVDASGKPLVVYHGSNTDIKVFDKSFSAQGVFWFSSDKDKIKRGESGASSSKFLIPVYLNCKNLAGWKEYEDLLLFQIKSMGFDGVKLDDDYIVFDPKQIKAVENVGTFKKASKNIYEASSEGDKNLLAQAREISDNLKKFFKTEGWEDKIKMQKDGKTIYVLGKFFDVPDLVVGFKVHQDGQSDGYFSELGFSSNLKKMGLDYIVNVDSLPDTFMTMSQSMKEDMHMWLFRHGFDSILIHELVHYLDTKRRKSGKITGFLNHDKDYFNSAHEFNAYFIQGLHDFLRAWGSDSEAEERFKKVYPTAESFVKEQANGKSSYENFWSANFVKILTPENRKKFIKRLALVWKDFFNNGEVSNSYKNV